MMERRLKEVEDEILRKVLSAQREVIPEI